MVCTCGGGREKECYKGRIHRVLKLYFVMCYFLSCMIAIYTASFIFRIFQIIFIRKYKGQNKVEVEPRRDK